MHLTHYDDGKQKWQSHEISIKDDDGFSNVELGIYSHDITDINGYGKTKEEALKDFKTKLEWLFGEYKKLEHEIFETANFEDTIVEVDCCGNKI